MLSKLEIPETEPASDTIGRAVKSEAPPNLSFVAVDDVTSLMMSHNYILLNAG